MILKYLELVVFLLAGFNGQDLIMQECKKTECTFNGDCAGDNSLCDPSLLFCSCKDGDKTYPNCDDSGNVCPLGLNELGRCRRCEKKCSRLEICQETSVGNLACACKYGGTRPDCKDKPPNVGSICGAADTRQMRCQDNHAECRAPPAQCHCLYGNDPRAYPNCPSQGNKNTCNGETCSKFSSCKQSRCTCRHSKHQYPNCCKKKCSKAGFECKNQRCKRVTRPRPTPRPQPPVQPTQPPMPPTQPPMPPTQPPFQPTQPPMPPPMPPTQPPMPPPMQPTPGTCMGIEDNTAYYGSNLPIQGKNYQRSWQDCQQCCLERQGCNFWTFFKSSHPFSNASGGPCYVKTTRAAWGQMVMTGRDPDYISGPKQCGMMPMMPGGMMPMMPGMMPGGD